MSDLNAFDDDQVARLARMLAAFEAGRLDRPINPPRAVLPGPKWTELGKVTVEVTAADGISNMGAGTVAVWRASDDGTHYEDTTDTEDVINPTTSAIAVGSWVELYRDPWTGQYWCMPYGVSGSIIGEVWSSGTFLSTADAAVVHLGVEINRGLTSYHPGAGKFVIDANLLDWQDGDARGMLDNDDQIISGDKYVTTGTAFGEGLGLWGVRVPYLAGPPVTYYETSSVSAQAQHGGVISHTLLASSWAAAGSVDNYSTRGAHSSAVDWALGHVGSRTTAGAEIVATASVPLVAGGYYTFCDFFYGPSGVDTTQSDGTYACRFRVMQDGTARLIHDNPKGTAYCVQDGAGALLTGGTAVTGGLTFSGGLYVSGSASAGGLTVGTTTITSGTSFGVLYNNGGVLGNTGAPSSGQILIGGSAPAFQTMSNDATINSTGVLTLAASGVAAATYGDATHVGQFTVDAKGRVTSASSVAITFPSSYTDEQAQDAVGNILTDSATIDFTYDDAANTITAVTIQQMSITSDASGLKLSGDSTSPGNLYVYSTNASGTKGWNTASSVSRTEGTVAAAGSVQGDAAAILNDAVTVSGADGTKGVILPNTAAGIVFVHNTHASNTLKVYPPSGAKITTVGTTNFPDALGAISIRGYCRVSSTQWGTIAVN